MGIEASSFHGKSNLQQKRLIIIRQNLPMVRFRQEITLLDFIKGIASVNIRKELGRRIRHSDPIAPTDDNAASAIRKLGLSNKFDVVMTIIGGAEYSYHEIERYSNTIDALTAVNGYFSDCGKQVALVGTPTNKGIMAASSLVDDGISLPRPSFGRITQLGVYPPLVMHGKNGIVSDEEYKADKSREVSRLAELHNESISLLPVKADTSIKRLDPTSPTYETDVQREWRAAADVLTAVSANMVKDQGVAVTVLFNGGNVATHEVARKLQQGEKIIVITNSGRLATVLTQIKKGVTPDSQFYQLLLQELGVSEEGLTQFMKQVVLVDPLPTVALPPQFSHRTERIIILQQTILAEAIIDEIEK
jgi:TRPM family ion channel